MFSTEFQDFIHTHQHADVLKLALQASLYPNIEMKLALQQIQGRQKAKTKLPFLYLNPQIIYPTALSVEQCSSEMAAKQKAVCLEKIVAQKKTLVDLTGGFGVDTYFFSQLFEQVSYVEQQTDLATIAKHNFEQLGAKNIACYAQNSIDFLQNMPDCVDAIYLDPARRDKNKNKVVSLADCEPDMLQILPLLFAKTTTILLKTSPMLDIKQTITQLACVSKVIVIAIENECKEVLYVLEKNTENRQNSSNLANYPLTMPIFETYNIAENKPIQEFSFDANLENTIQVSYSKPLQYIYEPNVAILKSGAFKSIATAFDLQKLHANTHLYTSTKQIPNFVGRSFEILAICKVDKKQIAQELSKYLPNTQASLQANITTRNFPLTVEEFRKKTGIKDGGNLYIFAVTDIENNKIVLISKKISTNFFK